MHQAIKMYGGREIEAHTFLGSVIDGGELLVSYSGCHGGMGNASNTLWLHYRMALQLTLMKWREVKSHLFRESKTI
jgi:hypothetical protein